MVRQSNPRKNPIRFRNNEEIEISSKPKRKTEKIKYRHFQKWLETDEDFDIEKDFFNSDVD